MKSRTISLRAGERWVPRWEDYIVRKRDWDDRDYRSREELERIRKEEKVKKEKEAERSKEENERKQKTK